MNEKEKAPCFRGHVRKIISGPGLVGWVGEIRTPAVFTALPALPSQGEAIAQAIARACTASLPLSLPLRQAA